MRAIPFLLLLLILCNQCANVMTPSGGPKDKQPPILLNSTPRHKQVNFKAQTVELLFDETIKLNNPREEIIISPSPGKEIVFRSKGARVLITPAEPWADSTTYSILFREGIQDITESNSPVNLKLAFSTGPTIDSLSMAGTVFDVLQGIPVEKITVAIYSSDTFDIFSSTPSFFTKTNKAGRFRLDNIKEGLYKIYAFDDKNKNLKVESRAEMYGFLSQPIQLRRSIDTLQIPIIRLDSRPLALTSIRNMGTITRLRFNKYLTAYSVDSTRSITHAFGDTQTEVNFWNPEGTDSLRLHFIARDSIENTIDTLFYIKRTTTNPVIEKFTFKPGSPSINPETARLLTTMKFSKPLLSMTMDSLYVQADSVTRFPITREEVTYNPHIKEVSIHKDMDKKMFGPNQDPRLLLVAKSMFAISMDGDTTKAESSPIVIYWPEENGTISVQAVTQEPHYVIQILNKSTKNKLAESRNNPRLTARNIPPGDYQIRVIIDRNQNGRWDPGNVLQGIEPEKIIYYKAPDGATSLPIRANWEIGPILVSF
ncbi:MAG: Ig-like domain-containing protein [Cytophagales bacterium]|nr:Ig-like domain-containing protein [Cytophagales bacterium]